MYEDLKPKQLAVLQFLKEHSGRFGYPPSVREICSHLDIKSTSTVFAILNHLEKKTYIRRDPTKPRAIEILDPSFSNSSNLNYNPEIIQLPLVGRIAAGQPILAEENIEEYMSLPSSHIKGKDCFMLRVSGDSMVNAGIFDKDYIIVDSSVKNPSNGDIVAALVDENGATVKTFRKNKNDKNKIQLIPENDNYEIMQFHASQVSILGRVTGVFRLL
ncbi:transcriptional repressor LexA [Peptostreptococcus equinus]|uniref:LexA repressor n=1 Tax=Peptostreptococcus equinus TaxID=3003601 RepID=A0ABY7JUF4_9FIRM|nr:transcriptional repressor LexA [Peptostreptococcus sp. CBA3647]WAW15723.1 transcriptional repressor LexA [Peptostreptococcus sp. CBA3647]